MTLQMGQGAHPKGHNTNKAPPPEQPKPVISLPNTVAITELITGCKVYIERGEEPARKAELLSIRLKKLTRAERQQRKEDGQSLELGPDENTLEYYVHYVEFNKRLDEWIPATRILLSREVEWPVPPAPPATPTPLGSRKSIGSTRESTPHAPHTPTQHQRKGNDSLLRKAALKAASSHNQIGSPGSALRKRKSQSNTEVPASPSPAAEDSSDRIPKQEEDVEMLDASLRGSSVDVDDESQPSAKSKRAESHGEDDDDGDMDVDEDSPTTVFSKSQEIEKLRTGGSMTQSHSEISRVKNLDRIQMGKHSVEAWYFSPYPIEYAYTPVLYVCEFCLSFYGSEKMMERHRLKCTLQHPPGNEIYRDDEISFFEIDGRKQKTWCRNLCLLSKCFLDHKTLYYDVDPFLYYVMCSRDDTGMHLIGYFSKEKESAENYNVACILTLPQYQRMGYGKLLIQFSYELSKKENKLGSPEKPLSDLGLLSYRAYWAEVIVGLLLRKEETSIDEIANTTSITHNDIMHTCQAHGLLKFAKGQHHLVVTDSVIEQYEKAVKKTRRRIEPEKLSWKPPVFSRNDLRFGF